MVFYRYQNTNHLERNSFSYVDVENACWFAFSYYIGKRTNIFEVLNYIKSECSKELCFRDNLKKEDYDSFFMKLAKIVYEYLEISNIDNMFEFKDSLFDEVRKIMKRYPLKGIFVIPQYNKGFEECGTKLSELELSSNICATISAKNAKYLAVYEGEVLCKRMKCGGTLINPTKLIKVIPVTINKDSFLGLSDIILRDVFNFEELNNHKSEFKKTLKDKVKIWGVNKIVNQEINIYKKELLLREILLYTGANFKEISYRYSNHQKEHLILVTSIENGKIFNFSIPDKDINYNDVINSETIFLSGEGNIFDDRNKQAYNANHVFRLTL